MGSCNADSNQTKHIVKMFVTSGTLKVATAVLFHMSTAALADQSSPASLTSSSSITYPWWLLLSSSVALVLIVVSIYLTRTRTKTVVHDRSDIEAILRADGVENSDVVGYVAFTGCETVGYVTDVGNNPEIELAEKHSAAAGGWVSQKLEGLP